MHGQQKQGHVYYEYYNQVRRNGIRKAKAQLELNLARNLKNNKKGFFRIHCAEKKK